MALNIDDGDWIPLFRKIRKHWLWGKPENLRAWVDLLMLANHKDGVFHFRGRPHVIHRGQVAATYLMLAKRNGWTRDRVRTFLKALASDSTIRLQNRVFDARSGSWIDAKSDRGFLLLTIVNYPVRKSGGQNPAAENAADQSANPAANQSANQPHPRRVKKDLKRGEEDQPPTPPHAPAAPAAADDDAPPPWVEEADDPGGEAPPAPPPDEPEQAAEDGVDAPAPPPPPPARPTAPPASAGGDHAGNGNGTAHDPFHATVAAFAAFTRPTDPHKRAAFVDLVRQGVTHERIREAARVWADWDFYDVVKALQAKRRFPNEIQTPSGVVSRPPRPPAGPTSAEVQARQDAARAKADQYLAELGAEEIAEWMRDAEAQAKESKVPEFAVKGFITATLRKRAAKRLGIEGL